MRDKLAEVIAEALTSEAMLGALCAGGPSSADIIASAVREYLGSDEVLDRAAVAFAEDLHNPLRAALSSIMEQSDGR